MDDITPDIPIDPRAQCISIVIEFFSVILQIVLKRKFFIQRSLPQEQPYIKVPLLMTCIVYTDV